MKGWVEKIDKGINNFLLPKFSEIDIFVATGFIVVLLVQNLSSLIKNVTPFYSYVTWKDFISNSLSGIFVLGMIVYFLSLVVKHLIRKEVWKPKEIEFAGYFYYMFIVVAIVASFIVSGMRVSQTTDYLRVFVVIRACLQLVLLGHLNKTNKSKVYTDRMTNEQVGSYTFLIGAVLILIACILLGEWYNPIDVFVLGNVYVGIVLIALKTLLDKLDNPT